MLLQELTWNEVAELDRGTIVVLPIAACEQHGKHLPLFTDSLLLGEVVRRTQQRVPQVLFAPLQWLGNSHHHIDFPGTLSSPPRLYLDLLNALLDEFIGYGFNRLVFLNGHGGNIVPGHQAIFEARQRYRDRSDLLLLFTSYWDLADLTQLEGLSQHRVGHACELETSMMLKLRPDLVKHYQKLKDKPFGDGFPKAYRGWTTKDRTDEGHIGEPALANEEKGERLFEAFTQGAQEFLAQIAAWDGSPWDIR